MALGFAIVTSLVLWFGFFSSAPKKASSSFFLPPPQEINIDFGVFEHPVFQELGAPFAPLQIPEETQKANPFIRP